MSNRVDPSSIFSSNQIPPTSLVLRMMEEHDFDTRYASGGSHIICTHPRWPEHGVTLVNNTDCVRMHKMAAKACIAVAKSDILATFEKAAKKEQAMMANIPDHISAELNHETGNLILRDKQLPQAGITIRPDQLDMLENKTRFLDDLKRETFIALQRARTQFDMDISVGKHDVFDGKLAHLVYDMPHIDIPDYQEGSDPRTLISALDSYTLQVLEKDLDHKQRLEVIAELPFIHDKLVIYHARRGERTLAIDYESPAGKPLHIQFECFSNARNPGDAHDITAVRIPDSLLDNLEHQMMGIARAHKRAKRQPSAEAA